MSASGLMWPTNRADLPIRGGGGKGTRAIEETLSNALRKSLTDRFGEKRTAYLVGRLSGNGTLATAVDDDGAVTVNGHFVGILDGFRFRADRAGSNAVAQASHKALQGEIDRRARRTSEADDNAF